MASTTTSKPTIVIVTGAFHVPEGYAKLTAALEAAGYEVHVPRLPTNSGRRPPNADLYDDSALVRSYVTSLVRAGRTVVALAHSYGGQVCSNALHGLGREARAAGGLRGGVSLLIYMTSTAGPEGTSCMTWVERFGHLDLMPVVFAFDEDGAGVPRDPRAAFVEPGYPNADEVDAYVETLVPFNGKAMYQPLEHAAWREIPSAYIITKKDMTLPLEYQKAWIENLESTGRRVQTVELDVGHAPQLTAAQDVVDFVNKIVSQ